MGQPVVIAEQVRGVTTPRAADPPSAVEIAGGFGKLGYTEIVLKLQRRRAADAPVVPP